MRTFATIIMSALMSLGLYTIYQATMKERAEQAAHIRQAEHCERIKQTIFVEVDTTTASGKFPDAAQQDYWAQLMRECP